jgi:hypothetical protein
MHNARALAAESCMRNTVNFVGPDRKQLSCPPPSYLERQIKTQQEELDSIRSKQTMSLVKLIVFLLLTPVFGGLALVCGFFWRKKNKLDKQKLEQEAGPTQSASNQAQPVQPAQSPAQHLAALLHGAGRVGIARDRLHVGQPAHARGAPLVDAGAVAELVQRVGKMNALCSLPLVAPRHSSGRVPTV